MRFLEASGASHGPERASYDICLAADVAIVGVFTSCIVGVYQKRKSDYDIEPKELLNSVQPVSSNI